IAILTNQTRISGMRRGSRGSDWLIGGGVIRKELTVVTTPYSSHHFAWNPRHIRVIRVWFSRDKNRTRFCREKCGLADCERLASARFSPVTAKEVFSKAKMESQHASSRRMGELLRDRRIICRRVDRIAIRRHDSDRGNARHARCRTRRQRVCNAHHSSFWNGVAALRAGECPLASDGCACGYLGDTGRNRRGLLDPGGPARANPDSLPTRL